MATPFPSEQNETGNKEPLDVTILELLASKICHDIISPIGAVNNGLEIFEEMGADAGAEVVELIAFSAQQASAKLKAFRLAYGAGGADSHIRPADVHKAVEDIVRSEDKVRQDWDPHSLTDLNLPEGFCKILMTALLLALETLPKGGTITLSIEGESDILIQTHGENAFIKEKTQEALSLLTEPKAVDPKNVHAYITGLLARHYNVPVTISQASGNAVSIRLVL